MDELEQRTEPCGFAHLVERHRSARAVHRVRHEHVLHALPFRLGNDQQRFLRRRVARLEHEVVLRCQRDDCERLGQDLAVARHRRERPLLPINLACDSESNVGSHTTLP